MNILSVNQSLTNSIVKTVKTVFESCHPDESSVSMLTELFYWHNVSNIKI